MVGAVMLGFVLQLLLIYVPVFQTVFKTQPLSMQDLFVCLIASAVVFVVLELTKLVKRRRGVEVFA
jgi:Ca2+-transporting ATPase